MRRLMMLGTVVLVTAAMLVVLVSTAAFARPLRGGVPLQNEKVCEKLAENHPRFEVRPDSPIGPCWHTSPGLEQASEVVPPA